MAHNVSANNAVAFAAYQKPIFSYGKRHGANTFHSANVSILSSLYKWRERSKLVYLVST
jgi:hypothetical protein